MYLFKKISYVERVAFLQKLAEAIMGVEVTSSNDADIFRTIFHYLLTHYDGGGIEQFTHQVAVNVNGKKKHCSVMMELVSYCSSVPNRCFDEVDQLLFDIFILLLRIRPREKLKLIIEANPMFLKGLRGTYQRVARSNTFSFSVFQFRNIEHQLGQNKTSFYISRWVPNFRAIIEAPTERQLSMVNDILTSESVDFSFASAILIWIHQNVTFGANEECRFMKKVVTFFPKALAHCLELELFNFLHILSELVISYIYKENSKDRLREVMRVLFSQSLLSIVSDNTSSVGNIKRIVTEFYTELLALPKVHQLESEHSFSYADYEDLVRLSWVSTPALCDSPRTLIPLVDRRALSCPNSLCL